MKYLTNVDLNKNQLLNPVGHKLATAPSTPVEGQEYYNTVDHKKYYHNGTDWIEMDGLGATMTGDNIISAINGSSSKIDDDNLSTAVNSAITNSHTHSNKTTLDNITAAFTSAMDTKLSGIESSADVTDAGNVGSSIYGTTAKTPLVDADTIAITNSESSNALSKITWSNFKASMKTYTDTLYNNYVHPNHTGDVTSTGDGATVIANKAVTLAKMADMATASLIGRKTASTGVPEVLSKADALTLLNVADGANNYTHPNHTGDVTSTGDGATVIGANKVTNSMLAQVATQTFKGRTTAGTGNVEDLTVAQTKTLLGLVLTQTSNATGFSLAGGTTSKTLKIDNTLEFAGTDSTIMTFPSTNASIARTDAGQSFTGNQTFNDNISADNVIEGYATTATAAGTTVLTVTSMKQQYFTGSSTQTVTLPVTSTLVLGHEYRIVNNSTGAVTVQSSGSNSVLVMAGGTSARFTCILTTGTTAASWAYTYDGTAEASGKKLTVSNSLTLSASSDGNSLNIGAGGTLGSAAFTDSTAYQASISNGTANQVYGMNNAGNAKEWKSFGAIGTSGTAPAWALSTANTITLNIPMASAGSVTAGLLSNTDYGKIHSQNTDTTLTGSGINVVNTTGSGNIVDFKVNSTVKASVDKDGIFTGTINWGSINSKPSSTTADIDDAVSKKHSQNTDTGTSSATFTVGTSGVKIKNSGGTELQIRNNGDSDYADLRVKNLVVEGTTTTVNSETIELADNKLLLNSNITTNAGNDDGGIAVKRLMADNSTRKDAELFYDDSDSVWKVTDGAVTGTLITSAIARKVVAAIGDGAETNYVITHNLNSRDLSVTIRETASAYALVYTDVEMTSVNTITVKFATAPTSSQYTVTIIG